MFFKSRARKKKALINLPFSKKSSVAVTPSAIKSPDTPVQQPVSVPKTNIKDTTSSPKKTVPLIKNNSLIFSNSISIHADKVNKSTEENGKEEVIINRPSESYTSEQFIEKWKAYKDNLLKNGKMSLATIFEYIPVITANNIDLLVENKALDEEFKHHKADFLAYIRAALNNFSIDVTTQINKEFKTKKAYTPQEKFEKMGLKNPHLNMLKNRLNMDVGYPK